MKDLRYSWIPHKLFYKLFCTVKDVLFLSVKSQSNHSGEKKKSESNSHSSSMLSPHIQPFKLRREPWAYFKMYRNFKWMRGLGVSLTKKPQ